MTQRWTRTVLWLALVLISSFATAQERARDGHGEQRREQWQKVDDVFQAMGVRQGAAVADLGAGDGFFTVRLARAVGEQGRVYAVDLNADTLRRLRARVANEHLAQVDVIQGAADDPRLPAGMLDAVLIVNAYHEMTSYREILAKLRTALKPDGRLVIVEPISSARRDLTREEQTRNHEIAIEFVKHDAREAGFVEVSMRDPFTTRATAHDDMWLLVLRSKADEKEKGKWSLQLSR